MQTPGICPENRSSRPIWNYIPTGGAVSFRDEAINVSDGVFIINYIFKGGPASYPVFAGDANCDQSVNIADAVHLINYIFKGGNKPCCCVLCGDECQ